MEKERNLKETKGRNFTGAGIVGPWKPGIGEKDEREGRRNRSELRYEIVGRLHPQENSSSHR